MLILKNGYIIDGSGQKGFLGSVIINQDKIIDVLQAGVKIPYKGEIIDCEGKIISPGFIDAHSHNDFDAVKTDNQAYFAPFIRQGVTSMIGGNCGFSITGFDKKTPHFGLVGGGLFSNDKLILPEFDMFEKRVNQYSPVNIASFVGHSTARIGVNGNGGEKLSEEQLQAMLQVMSDAMDKGALGVSLGLMYVPSKYAPYEELLAIAKLVKSKNKILSIHARACSKVSTSYNPPIGGRAHNLRALDEVIQLAKDSGVKIQLSHLIFVGSKTWGTVDESLRLIEEANQQGCHIRFDMYSLDFGASIITVILPSWYLLQDEKGKQKLWSRTRLALEIFVSIKTLGFGFQDILIANTHGLMKEIEGKRISQIASEWKMSQRKAYLKIARLTNYNASVLMYKYANDSIIDTLRKRKEVLYMSDAWIESQGVQNFGAYYNFVKFIILARDHQEDIEFTIAKMTGETATWYNLANVGYLKKGYDANITIFDLGKLHYQENKELSPEGIDYVFINGHKIIDQGKMIDIDSNRFGKLLK